jgi:hypothetical protein
MAIEDALICRRVDYLQKQIEQLDVITEWYPNYTAAVADNSFSTGWLQLEDNTSLMLFERYNVVEYKLKILRYCYIYRDSDKKEIFRADNREHHDVSTNPHHIHDFRCGGKGWIACPRCRGRGYIY